MSNTHTEPTPGDNSAKYINDSRVQKKEFISLASGYSNYLQKSLDRLTASSNSGIDRQLVSKITQIHKDKAEIENQYARLQAQHANLLKTSELLEMDLSRAQKYLLKKRLIAVDYRQHGAPVNNVQRKSELIDQDIRILESSLRILEEES